MRTCKCLVAAVLGLLVSAPARAEYDLTPRPLLTDGESLPPLGRVGRVQAGSNGIDNQGRLLVHADLTDGTSGVFWANGARLETLWRGGVGNDPRIVPGSAVTSPAGRVVASGFTDVNESSGGLDALYQVSPPPLRVLARVGDQTSSGDTIVLLYSSTAVNDDGSVAMLAYLEPLSAAEFQRQAVLLVRDDGIHVVAAEGSAMPPERRFDSMFIFGLSAAGEALIDTTRYRGEPFTNQERGIYAAGVDRIRPVLVEGDRSAHGFPFRYVSPIAAAPNGEVLLYACEDRPLTPPIDDDCECLDWQRQCATYRTDNGQLIRVAPGDDRTPDGYRFLVDGGSLANNGDAVVRATWVDERIPEPENSPLWSGLLRYQAGESARLIAAPAQGGASNNAGDVIVVPVQGENALGVSRWRDGSITPVIDAATTTEDNALFIGGGLFGPHCLAADGRAATFATFPDVSAALVCIDDDGTHVVAPLEEFVSTSRLQCGFADGEEIVFAVGEKIYRVSNGVVELVVGPGMVTDRGATIFGLERSFTGYQAKWFALNRSGTIVVRAGTSEGIAILRQRRGGPLEQIALDLQEGGSVREVIDADVADDETIVALGRLDADPDYPDTEATVVVTFDDDGGRTLFTDRALGGRPNELWTRGSLVALMINFSNHYVYDLRTERLEAMLEPIRFPELLRPPFLIDFAANGDALLFAYVNNPSSPTLNGRWLLSDDRVQLLSSDTSGPRPTTDPVALNTAGNILFEAIDSSPQVLSLSGPPATGRCPVTSAPQSNNGNDGCQVSRTAASSWSLLLPVVLLALARTASINARIAITPHLGPSRSNLPNPSQYPEHPTPEYGADKGHPRGRKYRDTHDSVSSLTIAEQLDNRINAAAHYTQIDIETTADYHVINRCVRAIAADEPWVGALRTRIMGVSLCPTLYIPELQSPVFNE